MKGKNLKRMVDDEIVQDFLAAKLFPMNDKEIVYAKKRTCDDGCFIWCMYKVIVVDKVTGEVFKGIKDLTSPKYKWIIKDI